MNSFKSICLCILSLVIFGCASLKSTARKYDTRLTTRVHTGTISDTYSNLRSIYNPAEWSQPYGGDFLEAKSYWYESWLNFRPVAKLQCTLYNRISPYGSNKEINALGWYPPRTSGRQTITLDTTYNITSDLQIRNGFRQHIYKYGFYNPPWSVGAVRGNDYGADVTNFNANSRNIESETSMGFTLNKRNSNISANVTVGRLNRTIYTDLAKLPDSGVWARKYEGDYLSNNYVYIDGRWNFTLSPKLRGDISGAVQPLTWAYGRNQYGNTRLGFDTYYKLSANWELQAGFDQYTYRYGPLNPYNPVGFSEWDWWQRVDPDYVYNLANLKYERKQINIDYWIGFDLRP
jgi:hypothetical protein